MNKTLATLAWAGIPALLLSLSACSESSGTTGMAPIPNTAAVSTHSRAHRDLSVNLHAGGATFPAFGYNLGVQPVGTPGPGQPVPGIGSVLQYASAHSFTDGANVFYCLTGSTKGKLEFEGPSYESTGPCAALGTPFSGFGAEQDPLDFVGSDVALASTECCASGTPYYEGRLTGSQTWGQPFEFPTFGGPIVFGYVQSSFTGLNASQPIKLSTWTYCAIANGTVVNWDDPAITADNGGSSVTGGVSEPITFYYRSDGSGTSYLFQYHLSNSTSGCNQTFGAPYNASPYGSASRVAAWPYGYSTSWKGPEGSNPTKGYNFVGESGNPGIIQGLQKDATGFGVGYVEGAWAASTDGSAIPIAQASVQNGFKKGKANFVSPTNQIAVANALKQVNAASISYGTGSDGNPLASTTPWCQLYIPPSSFAVTKTIKAYPIVGLSYWLFYGRNNGVHLADKTALVKLMANNTQIAAILQPLEYTPLGPSISNKITKALNGSGKAKPSCLQ